MDIGVFIPIGNNGWLISKSSPQYLPTFELNKAVVQKAEEHGLDFALSIESASDTTADDSSTARTIVLPEGAVNFNMGTLVGSYETVARMLDEIAGVDGTKGIMLVFDDFLEGIENFGTRVQPLMRSRSGSA
ncbi:LLM class flavin-dependent oxidoreductase [Streptomyces dysideae]|uniref:Luciferase-like domain-containing protein n=1 Tax=Streptomyces dysideae TaxID=909626 RepID=A0A101URI9_9ACTN|nr:LLM class flavin-dependent oxidoreductase [Streptomyces dysideae]KUO15548.1 hypothetical protein AQJ91_40845 [Streptomyces dysideae]